MLKTFEYDSLVYTYGHNRQRIAMEERVGGALRTKRYVGSCEYVTETEGGNTLTRSLTYLTGPFGVFAVVEKCNGEEILHYILKDNLGSWTTVTDSEGNVEQRLSYDAWGSLRDPDTWSGSFTGKPMFDRGFTGHEHLTAFGLINMNGRMYDPVMSSFLSVDRFLQNPSTSQGFNRYAYCMYNPLRYVDPTGFYITPGDSHHPDNPPYEIIDGQVVFLLPEVTITPYDEPTVTVNESYYPNTTSGGAPLFDWSTLINNNANGPSIGQGSGGNLGEGPNHKTPYNNDNNDSDLEIASDVLVTIATYTMIKSVQYYNKLTRTWKDKLDITRSFDFHGNGATGGMNSFGKAMSYRYIKASGGLNVIGIGFSSIELASAVSIDDKIRYGSDIVVGIIGFVPGGGMISAFWFLGGRNFVFLNGESMGNLIKDGINPGLMEYQPFK